MPDISIEPHGSVVLLRPLTKAAREWIDQNVESENWQWFGGALAVEPRCLENLYEGLRAAGLTEED